jgi:hypothetical protein
VPAPAATIARPGGCAAGWSGPWHGPVAAGLAGRMFTIGVVLSQPPLTDRNEDFSPGA